ncbi:MAG: hypothetical protein ACFFCW_26430 [Candidatus Hodarchaeota archaeon]
MTNCYGNAVEKCSPEAESCHIIEPYEKNPPLLLLGLLWIQAKLTASPGDIPR